MNYVLEVCLIAMTFVTNTTSFAAARPGLGLIRQTGVAVTSQAMQKGVSVEMPAASDAAAVPDADSSEAFVVTATRDGSIYLGANPVQVLTLVEELRGGLSEQKADQKENVLYIKSDARTPYAKVAPVLEAARAARIEATTLLTAQRESAQPGSLVSPKGLNVSIDSPDPQAVVLEVLSSAKGSVVKLGTEDIPWESLHSGVSRALASVGEKQVVVRVVVRAEGTVPFADVIRAIDICQSTGSKVVLAGPKS